MRTIIVEFVNIVISFILVTVLAVYGGGTSLTRAFKGAVSLIWKTVRAQNLFSNFYSVHISELINSLQLLSMALAMTFIIGIVLTIIPTLYQNNFLRATYDGLNTILESVPDAMYVVAFTIVFLLLFEWYHINLPVFSGTFHPSLRQTVFPALTISLPAGLYIRKMLGSRLEDELKGQYVLVVRSKGASNQKALFHHILPNLGPVLLNIAPSAVSILLSSVLFGTYFFEYQDVFNRFTQAVGWSETGGFREAGHIAGFVPTYQDGTVWLIGASLVGIWALCLFVCRILEITVYPQHREATAAFNLHPVRKGWIIVGTVIMLTMLFLGTFPHLLTPFTPDHIDYGHQQPWPLPQSATHPFGTDDIGRDLLSLILYGTWITILPVAAMSVLVTVVSVLLAALASFGRVRLLRTSIRGISHILSSLPAFYVIFLILYPENTILAHGHTVPVWKQISMYVGVIAILEIGRGTGAFLAAFGEWRQFTFLEGVRALGKSEVRAVFSDLRPWLIRHSLSFGFGELSRIMSLMTQLAAFRIFLSAKYGYLQFNYHVPPIKGVIPVYSTWFSTVGSVMNQFAFISYPYVLYYPLIFILLITLASNFIARGIRGGRV